MKAMGILHLRKSTNYRLFYNVISITGLMFILFLNATISSPYLIDPSTWTRYISLVVATAGILILKAAFKQYSVKGFLGFENDDQENFKASGILKHIRHPIYSGTILIVIGFWLFVPNL